MARVSESLMGDLQDQALTAFRSAEATLQKVSGAAHRGELHRDPKAVGVFLAFSSSAFIGASFVITRKALQRAAARGGKRAGEGGYAYFSEPLWWVGTLTMVVGEIANFSAYAFAPAILVTPLGAISIIISAILAHYHLAERLHIWASCLLCCLTELHLTFLEVVVSLTMRKLLDLMMEGRGEGCLIYRQPQYYWRRHFSLCC